MKRQSTILKFSFFLFFIIISFLFSSRTLAATVNCLCSKGTNSEVADCAACNALCVKQASVVSVCSPKATPKLATPGSIPDPIGTVDVNFLIARIINLILGLVGSISLLLFLYGGVTWMTSAGSADKVKKGRDIVIWAVIGLAVVFLAYILVTFVIQSIA